MNRRKCTGRITQKALHLSPKICSAVLCWREAPAKTCVIDAFNGKNCSWKISDFQTLKVHLIIWHKIRAQVKVISFWVSTPVIAIPLKADTGKKRLTTAGRNLPKVYYGRLQAGPGSEGRLERCLLQCRKPWWADMTQIYNANNLGPQEKTRENLICSKQVLLKYCA